MSDERDEPGAPVVVPRSTDTVAITRAIRVLSDHLDGPVDRGLPPPVVRVVGRPGAGKTYLLSRLVEVCSAARGVPVMLSVAGLRVDQLYGSFVEELSRAAVVSRVRVVLADVVGGMIGDPALAAETLRRAPAEVAGESPPSDVGRLFVGLGVAGPEVLDRLRERLAELVADPVYGWVLSMLVREGLDEPAWDWLRGAPPAPVLVELGVTGPAGGGAEGMATVARLFARTDARLVVLLDDLDRLVGGRHDRDRLDAVVAGVAAAGAAVFLASVDDPERGAGRRDGAPAVTRIALPGLDRDQALALLAELSPTRSLAPFGPDAAARLTDLAEGNPGLVRSLRNSMANVGEDVTLSSDDVDEGARRFFSTTDRERVGSLVRRVLDDNGWRFVHPRTVRYPPRPVEVDFWVYANVADTLGGCGIVVTDVVLDQRDLRALSATVAAVREVERAAPMLVVVVGPVSPRFAAELDDIVGRPPLPFTADSFTDDLTFAVKGMLVAGAPHERDEQTELRRRVEEMWELQSRTWEAVERLGTDVDRLHAQRERGPEAVEQVLDAALDGLRRLGPASTSTAGLFAAEPDPGAGDVLARTADVADDRELMAGLGALEIILSVVEEFTKAVRRWWRRSSASSTGLEELDRLGERYAEVVAHLPFAKVQHLVRGGLDGHVTREGVDGALSRVRALGDDVGRAARRP